MEELGNGSWLLPHAEEVCRELVKTCTLYIVTNGVSRTQRKRIGGSALADVFRDIFVSEEAGTAGKNAAAYVKGERRSAQGHEIRFSPVDGVRYTVPVTLNTARMDENLTVRFRVGAVYKNCYVGVYFDDERVIHRKRQIVAPGEMEEIKLTKEQLLKYPDLETITVKIEEA